MSLLRIAQEAIDFQSPELANQVTELLTEILKSKNGKAADESAAATKLMKIFNTETNLKLDIKFSTAHPPCMMPIHINPDTILGDNVFKSYYTKDANKIIKDLESNSDTYVDLKNAKVGGAFTIVPTPIYMGFKFLKDLNLSAREVAAVLMHEVGHAFVAYELAFNTIRTNQILLALHKSLISNDQKLFEYTLKFTEKKIGTNSGVYTELKDETDSKVVTTVVMAKMMEHRKSELGTAAYDKTTYEALADNYATRMGLGRDLVTALEKIHRTFGSPEYSGTTRFAISAIQITSITYFMLMGFVTGAPILGLILGGPLFFLIAWLTSDGAEQNNVYDKLQTRYKRVREQTVTRLKNKHLDPTVVKNTLEDLKVLDKAVSESRDFTSLMGVVGNIIYPSNWVLSSRKNAQRLLEELAANELFVKASQLRSM